MVCRLYSIRWGSFDVCREKNGGLHDKKIEHNLRLPLYSPCRCQYHMCIARGKSRASIECLAVGSVV